MGTQATPPNQVLLGIALFLTFFIMSPVLNQVYDTAWVPLTDEVINFEEFLLRAQLPFREFMLAQTREPDLALFVRLADVGPCKGQKNYQCASCYLPLSPASSRRPFKLALPSLSLF